MKFDGLLHKTIGELFYTASNFVHHFKSIGEFKLELQSGNAQFGSKSVIFKSRVTLKLDEWPWKTIGHLFYTMLSFVISKPSVNSTWITVQKPLIWVEISNFLSRVTFKFDGWSWRIIGHLFYTTYAKLCASFHSHQWIQTWVTVRKRPVWVKISNFFVPYDLEIWWMTLKNNRAPLLYYTKHCASFQSRQ